MDVSHENHQLRHKGGTTQPGRLQTSAKSGASSFVFAIAAGETAILVSNCEATCLDQRISGEERPRHSTDKQDGAGEILRRLAEKDEFHVYLQS